MASSNTTICNLALGKLGAARIIGLSEESPEARACLLHYDQTRDEVLRSHRWNFAIKRATLTKIATAPVFGWQCQYALPVDCLRVLQVNRYEENESPDVWEVEARNLLTDEDAAQIKYISRVEDVTLYDALFIGALAVKLAEVLCIPLTGSDSRAAGFMQEYQRITGPLARRTDSFEGRGKVKPAWVTSKLVASRFS